MSSRPGLSKDEIIARLLYELVGSARHTKRDCPHSAAGNGFVAQNDETQAVCMACTLEQIGRPGQGKVAGDRGVSRVK